MRSGFLGHPDSIPERFRQQIQLPDGPDADLAPVDLRIHSRMAELPFNEGQEFPKFLRRAHEVFRGEDPDGDHLDSEFRAPLQRFLQLGRTAPMALESSHHPQLSDEAAIPIQDQANVPGKRMLSYFDKELSLVEAIEEGCQHPHDS
jgi:hypothetical protein